MNKSPNDKQDIHRACHTCRQLMPGDIPATTLPVLAEERALECCFCGRESVSDVFCHVPHTKVLCMGLHPPASMNAPLNFRENDGLRELIREDLKDLKNET